MTILVTGVAGFIGYHVAEALLERDIPVIGIDNMNSYYNTDLKRSRLARLAGKKRFAFNQVSVAARNTMLTLTDVFSDISGIIHLAAQPGVRHSLENPYDHVDANVMGQTVMLECCRRFPKLKHFVYASSSSVYGRFSSVPFRENDIGAADQPSSAYGATKRAGELLAEAYTQLYGFRATGLRFFTVYGPWGRPDMAYYGFTEAIMAGRPIILNNHGQMARDFTFVNDIVNGVLASLAWEGDGQSLHQQINLGNNRPEELQDLVKQIEEAVGRKAIIEYTDMQKGEVVKTWADITKAEQLLGYKPAVTLAEGIPQFVEWYKSYHGV
ncbi:MAG: NAD-dependent epimerase/dehydratase family protein [Alphaproteobacteria bacterium]